MPRPATERPRSAAAQLLRGPLLMASTRSPIRSVRAQGPLVPPEPERPLRVALFWLEVLLASRTFLDLAASRAASPPHPIQKRRLSMTSTTTLTCPEFTVVRRLRGLGAEAQRSVVPRQRFSEELRGRLVEGTQRRGQHPLRRVSGSDCVDC